MVDILKESLASLEQMEGVTRTSSEPVEKMDVSSVGVDQDLSREQQSLQQTKQHECVELRDHELCSLIDSLLTAVQ